MKLLNNLLKKQFEAVAKLEKFKVGALFMEQGTGKTITALELYRKRLILNKVTKLIWLCPCAIKNDIKREILKQVSEKLAQTIIICGIESLSTSIRINCYLNYLVEKEDCFLVIDESLLVKNPKALRTKNIINLASKCKYKYILNGTPISRNESDLFSQFFILDWRILGYKSYWSFSANHLEFDEYNKKIIRTLNTKYLAERIEPYTYQCLKKDCFELPPKEQGEPYYFDLTPKQEEHYVNISERLIEELNESKPETIYRLFYALESILSGKFIYFKENGTICTKPFFDNPYADPRIKALLNIISNTTEKIIICCKYTSEINNIINILNEKFYQEAAIRYNGKIKAKDKAENIIKFKNKAQFLVVNISSAKFGLNLQFCNRVIFYSNQWNYAYLVQLADRVHRYEQKNKVLIDTIVARGTLDERIIQCTQRKEKVASLFKTQIAKCQLKEFLFINKKKKILDLEEVF